MILRGAGLAVVAFSLIGCAEREAKQAVAAEMRDPDAAQFRSIWSSSNGVCGEVNGKNAFGAYVGFRPFIYNRSTKSVSVLDLTSFSQLPDQAVMMAADFRGRQNGLCGTKSSTIL